MAEKVIRTTCSYCSTGCNLDAHLKDGRLESLRPAADYPVNLGKSCPKGFHLLTPFLSSDRALSPMVRRERGGPLEPTDWDTALATFVSRFKQILEKHGPESVAFLSTGQIPTEEMAFLGALAKFGMGLVHGDGNTRQCMATAAVAYKQAFGFDAPPLSYKDFEESDLLVFVGANPVIAHPIMWNRVKMNRKNPTIVVIDPAQDQDGGGGDPPPGHQPQVRPDPAVRPGQHHHPGRLGRPRLRRPLDRGLRGVPLPRGPVQRRGGRPGNRPGAGGDPGPGPAHPRGPGASPSGGPWGSTRATRPCARPRRIINLALLTGHIGRPGTGPNSITGQANAMGSRLFSNTTSLMGGYDFLNEAHRRHVAGILGIDPQAIPKQNSWPYHRILQGVNEGVIKGLWILATNPVHSWIDKSSLGEVLRQPRVPGGAGPVRDHGHRPARRPSAAGGRQRGEGRHLHQL